MPLLALVRVSSRGVGLTTQPTLDPGEAIAVELHPFAAMTGLIAAGTVDQALVLSAFCLLTDH
jgi:hypothetical protein